MSCWFELMTSQTCRKGHEGIALHKLSVFVQKVSRIEAMWTFPFGLIVQDRGQERNHCGPL